jgi:hypothetical protein
MTDSIKILNTCICILYRLKIGYQSVVASNTIEFSVKITNVRLRHEFRISQYDENETPTYVFSFGECY